MATTTKTSDMGGVLEREMNRYQRGLVDTCYEEGHYEAGISILDKLRTQHFKPSPAHIRQLIYIALFPPSQPASETKKGKGKEREDFGTPSKVPTATKHNRASLLPTAAATEAAKTLLVSFVMTNTPEALIRAVPCYPLNEVERASRPDGKPGIGNGYPIADADENEDSYVAKEATLLKECKDCWSMVKGGVVKRKEHAKEPGPATKRKHRSDDSDDSDGYVDADDGGLCVVGQHSWPVLEWLIMLFEHERSLVSEHYPFSLLSQIKPPRSESGPRWDAETPLDIVFTCCKQTELRRQRLGARLMSLLIDLTNNPHFSASHLITLATSRLRALPVDELSAFLSDLPVDGRGPAFKLAICDKYLINTVGANMENRSAPKPQVRRARPLYASPQKESPSSTPLSASQVRPGSSSRHHPWTLPTVTRIQQLLDHQLQSSAMSSSYYLVKFHLFMTFGTMKAQERSESHCLDSSWMKVLNDDQLESKVSHCFSDGLDGAEREKSEAMREILMRSVSLWRRPT